MTESNFQGLFDALNDPPPSVPTPQKKGRAKGKRSDPNYTQVGAYIPKELDKAVKRKLFDTEQDFSSLVADLLTKWLSDEAVNQQSD